ncbi:tetratricopeptide repeat protein [Pseudanabaena sp. BC1403]|uniref:tetratricopeptide repeat protein n=1 Tax=Pseudanabaena sp. BC1403 TaxID=2043171 RepID=UPI000CD83A32|nr:tetratricopeptide repeat protein [Pseudanabaena sp. BC1403]
MPVITIREEQQVDDGFLATLRIDGRDYPNIKISDPFLKSEEARLEWYFEQWLRFPMLDTTRAADVAASIREYGTRLFDQIFADRKAYADYLRLRDNLGTLRFEIEAINPEFQAWHWEAMRDAELPYPLAVDCVMVRKSTRPTAVMAAVNQSPTLNVLMVTARPSKNDVAYRVISRPLIEALGNSQLPVKIDLLRPATFEGLSRHLEDRGAGHYHMIHFDCHGALLTYDQCNVENKAGADALTFKQRYGRTQIAAYSGVKAFLVLEGNEDGEEDLVEATELADLLTGKRIPVCMLNACQSGKQLGTETGLVENYRETSLGSLLMAAGMQMVVAMGYSVTVTAAKVMMAAVYEQIFNKKLLEDAVRLGRRELFNQKERSAYFNYAIPLEDWLLPVVYGTQQVDLNLREFTAREEEAYFESLGRAFQFVQPEYEFVGRDLDILRIEKALARHNMLLLQGMGGTGKTTLLNFLREWWEKTHFADGEKGEQIFYFGYDERAWTLEQILFALGQRLYDRFEMGRFQAMSQAAQVPKMVALLRGAGHVLILDNLESVTGEPLAIPNTLPQAEQVKLRDFLKKLAGGKTRVVFGSRCGEDWLKAATFQQNVYGLRGLDQEARTLLAQRILARHVPQRVKAIEADPEFTRLMKVLAGYPLALEVVLPNLKGQSPSQVLEALQAADFDLDSGSEDKTKSILKCVEYSHSNLSPDAQRLLICLAPFTGFISRDAIPKYAEELQKLESFQDYDFANFDAAIQEAINWGLLEGMDEANRLLTIQPIFPYFLKTKLASLDEPPRKALQEGFKNHYQIGSAYYNQLMKSKDPQQRQIGIFLCRLEYENLYNALQTCLANQETIDIFFCLDEYFEVINDIQSNLKLSEFVCKAQESYSTRIREGEYGYQIGFALHTLASRYQETKQYQQAKIYYEKALESYKVLKETEEKDKKIWSASTYNNLGAVAKDLREYGEARQNYQQALAIDIEFGDRYSQASTYHELGRLAQELREYGEARQNYQQALEIKIEFGDRYSQALTYHQLGILARELREYGEARQNYQQALAIFIEFGDRHTQASTYQELGTVALELREYEEARQNYQQALAIYIEFGDRYSQASTYQNLGIVAQELREYEEARQNYQQALAIYIEFGDRYSQAITYHQLGTVALELREYEEARQNYQQALAIKIEFGDLYSQAITYHQLGRVAEELREYGEARQNYQQALAIKIEFGNRYSQASTYHQLGRVAEKLREYGEARQNYQQALAIKIEFGDRYSQASTYQNLGIVAQELREYEEARQNYQQALAIYIEFGDRYYQASTYHNLGYVAQDLREYGEARQNYQQALSILIEFGDRYSQAITYEGLGRVAEELEEFPEAKNNFLQALRICHKFKDEYNIQTYSIPNLSRLYQATQDQSLLEEISQVLGITIEEVRQKLEST